jgi:uncharacterized membrane protein
MKHRLLKSRAFSPFVIVGIAVTLYILVFSFMSIRRIHVLWASYFDLGIMHQTVYNTYKAIQTLDPTRILELTDPHESGRQINRIAIHNDVLIALASPFYFIHSGPETLLVIQTIVLASGAFALFFIVREKTKHWPQEKRRLSDIVSTLIPLAYLLYYPIQKTNLYEFHAVTFATSLILWMYLAYIKRKWALFAILFIATLLSKEQVGFSLGIFAFVEALLVRASHLWRWPVKRSSVAQYLQHAKIQGLILVGIASFVYVALSVFIIMPAFRLGGEHFALNYFAGGDTSPLSLLSTHAGRLFRMETVHYLWTILSPLLLLPLFSVYLLPAVPDILINVLSVNGNMRNVYFQYTAVITPWLFISIVDIFSRIMPRITVLKSSILVGVLMLCIMISSSLESPLPYSRKNQNRLWYGNESERRDVLLWQQILRSDDIIVSATGQFAPYLTSRRIYYDFGKNYDKAEYVLVRPSEIKGYWIKGKLIPYYDKLIKDERYKQIYNNNDIEVYKRVPGVN